MGMQRQQIKLSSWTQARRNWEHKWEVEWRITRSHLDLYVDTTFIL